jgi:hypothetical protein
VRHLGGAFARHVEGAGAHGPVAEPYSLLAIGVPAVPQLVPAILAAYARLDEAVAPVTSPRRLLNFMGEDGDPADWWSPDTRSRLAAAKRVADPLGLVRSNRPIRT